jgi:hypothetical protein
MDDAYQKTGQHQPYCGIRIDAGPAVVGAVEIGDLSAQSTQIEDAGDTGEHMLIEDQAAQRAGEELELLSTA